MPSDARALPHRVIRGGVRFAASSALATLTIALVAIVLAWATWIESGYGTAAVQFGVYQSAWFAALLAILGLNVLAAAVVRFPWRRRQTGFVIVHAGILILLAGCWVSARRGVDARLVLYEGDTASAATDDARQFFVTIRQIGAGGRGASADQPHGAAKSGATETVRIPFQPGPFNWRDYDAMAWFPWRWVRPDRGVLYDRDGVRLAVLDYCSDSRRVPVPELKLRLPEEATLAVRAFQAPHMAHRTVTLGSQVELAARTSFQMAATAAGTAAFRDSRPDGPLGPLGQIVLHARGKKHTLGVDELHGKGPVPLGDSGLRVALAKFDAESLRVLLEVYAPGEEKASGLLLLGADRVDLDQQDAKNGVYGVYWFGPEGSTSGTPEETTKDAARAQAPKEARLAGGLARRSSQDSRKENGLLQTDSTPEETTKDAKATKTENDLPVVPPEVARRAAQRRVDILQGSDLRLYYRTWSDGRVGTIGELPADGSNVVMFADSASPVTYSAASFRPSVAPGEEIEPLPFDPEKRVPSERVLVRLSVGESSRDFWLADRFADDPQERFGGVRGEDRLAMVRVERRPVELGFRVRLREFECRYDPGTSRASHYESRVDFLTAGEEATPLAENVTIGPNRPARFTDPASGRLFRFFQTGFDGPYAPEQMGETAVDSQGKARDRIYRSDLTVAYDPGRQLKYAGCLMILAGTVVMYYMKAYLFRRRTRPIAAEQ